VGSDQRLGVAALDSELQAVLIPSEEAVYCRSGGQMTAKGEMFDRLLLGRKRPTRLTAIDRRRTDPRRRVIMLTFGFYFAFVSGLTIGYGDLAPKSLLTRTLAVLIGICGVLVTALVAAVAVKALTAATDGGVNG
jgi:ion channel